MKFRRKSAEPADSEAVEVDSVEAEPDQPEVGPFDVDDLAEEDDTERVDLGSLLLEPVDGIELRLQVDEATQEVQAVMMAGPDGALELRAFAAPRNGDLWSEVRPRIAADFAQRGGTATEREGRFGPELFCEITVQGPDGRTGTQPSRVIGVNGSRWLLRATLLGMPAQDVGSAGAWEELIERVVVRRGAQAMPVGSPLPLILPTQERIIDLPGDSA